MQKNAEIVGKINRIATSDLSAEAKLDALAEHAVYIVETLEYYAGEIFDIPPDENFEYLLESICNTVPNRSYTCYLGELCAKAFIEGLDISDVLSNKYSKLNTQQAKFFREGFGPVFPTNPDEALCARIIQHLDTLLLVMKKAGAFIKDNFMEIARAGKLDLLRTYKFGETSFWQDYVLEADDKGKNLLDAVIKRQLPEDAIAFFWDVYAPGFLDGYFNSRENSTYNWIGNYLIDAQGEFTPVAHACPEFTLVYFLLMYGLPNQKLLSHILNDEADEAEKILKKLKPLKPGILIKEKERALRFLALQPSSDARHDVVLAALPKIHQVLMSLEKEVSFNKYNQKALQQADTVAGRLLRAGITPLTASPYESVCMLKLKETRSKFREDRSRGSVINGLSVTGQTELMFVPGVFDGLKTERYGEGKQHKSLGMHHSTQYAYLFAWLCIALRTMDVSNPQAYVNVLSKFKQKLYLLGKTHMNPSPEGIQIKKALLKLVDAIQFHPPKYIQTVIQKHIEDQKRMQNVPLLDESLLPDHSYRWLRDKNKLDMFYIKYIEFCDRLLETVPEEVLRDVSKAQLHNTLQVLHYTLFERSMHDCSPIHFNAEMIQDEQYYFLHKRNAGICQGPVLEALLKALNELVESVDKVRLDTDARVRYPATHTVTYFDETKDEPATNDFRYHRSSPTQIKHTYYWMMCFALASAKPEFIKELIGTLKGRLFTLSNQSTLRAKLIKLKQQAKPSEFAQLCMAFLDELNSVDPETAIRRARTAIEDAYFSYANPYFVNVVVRLFGLSDVMGHFANLADISNGVFAPEQAPQTLKEHLFIMARVVEIYAGSYGKYKTLNQHKYNRLFSAMRDVIRSPSDNIANYYITVSEVLKGLHYPLDAPLDEIDSARRATVVRAVFNRRLSALLDRSYWYVKEKDPRPNALPAVLQQAPPIESTYEFYQL